MNFESRIYPRAGEPTDGHWFVFDKKRILIKRRDAQIDIPESDDFPCCGVTPQHTQYIGALDGCPCYAAEGSAGAALADGFEWIELLYLFSTLDDALFWVAGRANHLVHWNRNHQYCGSCGLPMENKGDERAKMCTGCGLINYPRLSPAVIVAVLKDDKILLARNALSKIPFYSILAGFVEPGESLEDCILREVKEEVGITVKNIRYFGSQPWPFPDSLMIGFTTEYAGGEISPDLKEIMDAGWFTKDSLPRIPPNVSIAGQMIEWFCKR